MSTDVLPEPQVAKNKSRTEAVTPPASDAAYERIEFQARPGFIADLDRACKKRGLSRAAYIRQAVLLMIQQDERESMRP